MKKQKNVNVPALPGLFDDAPVSVQPTIVLNQLLLTRPLVFFDLETTGLDSQADRIVQFAFLRVDADHQVQAWTELVNPGMPIPAEAARVHGITDVMVANKPCLGDFCDRMVEFLENCDLAGYNILRFDLPFLQAELERNGRPMDFSRALVIDSQVIFHKKEPRDLSAAVRLYCGREMKHAHDAAADIAATLEVLNGQLARYPDLGRDPAKLAAYCSNGDRQRWLTSDRKFYWKNNEAVISFGKNRGKSLQWLYENDLDYLRWMSEKDFAEETLVLIQAALRQEFPQKNSNE